MLMTYIHCAWLTIDTSILESSSLCSVHHHAPRCYWRTNVTPAASA